jgi:hypothetical protein
MHLPHFLVIVLGDLGLRNAWVTRPGKTSSYAIRVPPVKGLPPDSTSRWIPLLLANGRGVAKPRVRDFHEMLRPSWVHKKDPALRTGSDDVTVT